MADTAGSAGEVRVKLTLDASDMKNQVDAAARKVGGSSIKLSAAFDDKAATSLSAELPGLANKLDTLHLQADLASSSIESINKQIGGIDAKITVPVSLKISAEDRALLKELKGLQGAPAAGPAAPAASAARKVTKKAAGGHVSANETSMVGENGPEMVRWGSSGTVIPAHNVPRRHDGGELIRYHKHNDDMSMYKHPRTGRWMPTIVRSQEEAELHRELGRTRRYDNATGQFSGTPGVSKVVPREKGTPRDPEIDRFRDPLVRARHYSEPSQAALAASVTHLPLQPGDSEGDDPIRKRLLVPQAEVLPGSRDDPAVVAGRVPWKAHRPQTALKEPRTPKKAGMAARGRVSESSVAHLNQPGPTLTPEGYTAATEDYLANRAVGAAKRHAADLQDTLERRARDPVRDPSPPTGQLLIPGAVAGFGTVTGAIARPRPMAWPYLSGSRAAWPVDLYGDPEAPSPGQLQLPGAVSGRGRFTLPWLRGPGRFPEPSPAGRAGRPIGGEMDPGIAAALGIQSMFARGLSSEAAVRRGIGMGAADDYSAPPIDYRREELSWGARLASTRGPAGPHSRLPIRDIAGAIKPQFTPDIEEDPILQRQFARDDRAGSARYGFATGSLQHFIPEPSMAQTRKALIALIDPKLRDKAEHMDTSEIIAIVQSQHGKRVERAERYRSGELQLAKELDPQYKQFQQLAAVGQDVDLDKSRAFRQQLNEVIPGLGSLSGYQARVTKAIPGMDPEKALEMLQRTREMSFQLRAKWTKLYGPEHRRSLEWEALSQQQQDEQRSIFEMFNIVEAGASDEDVAAVFGESRENRNRGEGGHRTKTPKAIKALSREASSLKDPFGTMRMNNVLEQRLAEGDPDAWRKVKTFGIMDEVMTAERDERGIVRTGAPDLAATYFVSMTKSLRNQRQLMMANVRIAQMEPQLEALRARIKKPEEGEDVDALRAQARTISETLKEARDIASGVQRADRKATGGPLSARMAIARGTKDIQSLMDQGRTEESQALNLEMEALRAKTGTGGRSSAFAEMLAEHESEPQTMSPFMRMIQEKRLAAKDMTGRASGGPIRRMRGGGIFARQPAPHQASDVLPELASHPGAAIVGERGPEKYHTPSGVYDLGRNGPEVIVPAESGIVSPNHYSGDPSTIPGISSAERGRLSAPPGAQFANLPPGPMSPFTRRAIMGQLGASATFSEGGILHFARGGKFHPMFGDIREIKVRGRTRYQTLSGRFLPNDLGGIPYDKLPVTDKAPVTLGRLRDEFPIAHGRLGEAQFYTPGGGQALAGATFNVPDPAVFQMQGAGQPPPPQAQPPNVVRGRRGRRPVQPPPSPFQFQPVAQQQPQQAAAAQNVGPLGQAPAAPQPAAPQPAAPQQGGQQAFVAGAPPVQQPKLSSTGLRAQARSELRLGSGKFEGKEFSSQIAGIRSDISEQLSLTPVRALSVSIGQIFQQAIGGRAQIQSRAADANVAAAEAQTEANFLDSIRQERAIARGQQRIERARTPGFDLSDAGQELAEKIGQLDLAEQVQQPVVEAAVEKAREKESGISTRTQRTRAQALGLGGIVAGTVLFTAAMQGAQAVLAGIAEIGEPMIDAMTGFTKTANKVAEDLASATVGGTGGAAELAAARARIGLSIETPETDRRAQLLGGAQNFEQAQRAVRAETNLSNRPGGQGIFSGFNNGLFSGIPVLEDIFGWIGQTQSISERLAGTGSLRTRIDPLGDEYPTTDVLNALVDSLAIGDRAKDLITGNFGEPRNKPAPLPPGDDGYFFRFPWEQGGLFNPREGESGGIFSPRVREPGVSITSERPMPSGVNPALVDAQNKQLKEATGLWAEINDNLSKVNPRLGEFVVPSTLEDVQARVGSDESKAFAGELRGLGQTGLADVVESFGIEFVNKTSKPLGEAVKSAFEGAALGATFQDPGQLLQSMTPQITAQIRAAERSAQFQTDTVLPVQFARERLVNPLPTSPTQGLFAESTFGGAVRGAETLQKYAGAIRDVRAEIESFTQRGLDEMVDTLGVDPSVIQSVQKLGEENRMLGERAESLQLGMDQERYNEQLRISRRNISDLIGLTGRQTASYQTLVGIQEDGSKAYSQQTLQASELGRLQRAQIGDQRELARIGLARSQRELNLQLALARLQSPGETPQERAVRRREAELIARERQRELDINKNTNQRGIRIEEIGFGRQLEDALRAQGLSESERTITMEIRGINALRNANELLMQTKLGVLDTTIGLGQQLKESANQTQATIEAQSAQFLDSFGDEVRGVFKAIRQEYRDTIERISSKLPTIAGISTVLPGQKKPDHNTKVSQAAGGIFDVKDPTRFVAGEAGGEQVVVLRNPRSSMTAGGGGGTVQNITVQINNAQVRKDSDIDELADKVIKKLHREAELVGA